MLHRNVVSLNVLPCLAILFHIVQSDDVSIALQRQLLIHHEPPFDNHFYGSNNNVTEHFITQRLDNFDHQNQETFQMVSVQEGGGCRGQEETEAEILVSFVIYSALFAKCATFQIGWTDFYLYWW